MAGVAVAFGVLIHLAIVFSNDVADERGDRDNAKRNLFSGGSGVLVEGKLSGPVLLRGAWAAAFGLLLLGGLSFPTRPSLLPLAALALAMPYLYSFPPFRLSDRGYGEILQGLCLGLGLPVTGYYLQAGTFAALPWDALAPLVVYGFASHILTALPDTESDRRCGKRTWPVRRGEGRARRDALALLGLALLLVGGVADLAPWALGLVALPPALLAAISLRWLRVADSTDRPACLKFVFFALGGATLFPITYATALFLA